MKYVDPNGKEVITAITLYVGAVVASPDTMNDVNMLAYDLSQGDWTGAALDGVSLAVPGLTNLSPGYKAAKQFVAKYADDVADAAKNLIKTSTLTLRNSPGIVTAGRKLTQVARMMRGSHGNIGVIPQEIALKLKGLKFGKFDDFREAFWKAVADSGYAKEFSASNVTRMKTGKAPFAVPSQWFGKKVNYVLHHIKPINAGGDVYDLSNILIVTPRMHEEILNKVFHLGK